jgi:uncharacterized protein (DUF488 family)
MANPFFTVGHSTHAIEEFVALLTDIDVELVADVRAVPRSGKNPQYNRDVLSTTLRTFKLDYMHIPELGGLRSRRPVLPTVNGFWQNERFHNYADYAMSEEFRVGLRRLRELGHAQRCAVMCAEAVWWRCHRRIIADYLIAAGETVIHILAKGRTEPAHITEGAVHAPNCSLVYPRVSRIVGYHQDEEENWVAELSCGHQQHVRHRPPLTERPWVLTEAGRAAKIGQAVVCAECMRAPNSV